MGEPASASASSLFGPSTDDRAVPDTPATASRRDESRKRKEEDVEPSEISCICCCTTLTGKYLESTAVYPCRACFAAYCTKCLALAFNKASIDESLMPPRCHGVIPLHAASPYMDEDELERYKARYEEWSTPNRFYCPLPTCSAFIPPRLLPPPYSNTPEGVDTPPAHRAERQNGASVVGVVIGANGKHRPSSLDQESREPVAKRAKGEQSSEDPEVAVTAQNDVPEAGPSVNIGRGREAQAADHSFSSGTSVASNAHPTVCCPKCSTQICCECRQIHSMGTPCIEPDAALAKLLKEWKIKRCPRCGTGIRRMYGCSHIRCRCGANWCWYCENSDQYCDGCDGASGEDLDDEIASDNLADPRVDLDTIREGMDFGGEPYTDMSLLGCQHEWELMQPEEDLGDLFKRSTVGTPVCSRCWTTVYADPAKTEGTTNQGEWATKTNSKGKERMKEEHVTPENPSQAWECWECKLILCTSCKDHPTW